MQPSIALVLLLGGCKSEEPATDPRTVGETAPTPSSPEPILEAKPKAAASTPEPEDSEPLESKLADLDDLCKALDHDYVDGTLSDYYRGIEPRTAWGKAQRDAGNESMKPGRLLEKAVAELSEGGAPALEHCRKLLDYLDDVE